MFLFRCIYRKSNDGTEYDLNIIAKTPNEVERLLTKKYGELPYFFMTAKYEIHYIMDDIKENIFLELQRKDNETKG